MTFLVLKTLTVVQKSLEFVKQSTGEEYDILENSNLMIRRVTILCPTGISTGVFQLESTGMKDVLRKMKPDRFEDIIALVSLYRPGPMDNIPKYISTKDGKEEPDYLTSQAPANFGRNLWDHDLSGAGHAGRADSFGLLTWWCGPYLRRAMGKKIKEEMDKERTKFVEGRGRA